MNLSTPVCCKSSDNSSLATKVCTEIDLKKDKKMFSVVICKMFQSQVSRTNVRDWGTLLQDALAERKSHFVRVLLEFGYICNDIFDFDRRNSFG